MFQHTLLIFYSVISRHAAIYPTIVDDQLAAAPAETCQIGVIGIQGMCNARRFLCEIFKVVLGIAPVRIVVEEIAEYSG